MSTLVYLGLGSNQDRDHHLGLALEFLAALLVDVQYSPVYSSAAAGCVGDDFFNVVLSGRTDLSLGQLSDVLKRFEARYARVLVPRIVLPVDIDILLYGDFVGTYAHGVLPRSDLIDRPYVIMPLAVLAPEAVHPVTGKTYKTTWLEFERHIPAEEAPVLVARDRLSLPKGAKTAGADDFVMAQTLKSLRIRQGLTQRKLAEKARVTHSSISVIEKNQASPGVNTLGKILSALSTSLPEFFAEIERGGAEVKPKKRVLEF